MKNISLLILFSAFCVTAFCQKLSINISIGTTVGLGKMIPIEGYTPYFINYTAAGYAHDVSLKYYFNPKTALELGIVSYTRYGGLKIETLPTENDPRHWTNISLIDSGTSEAIPTLRFYRALVGESSSKFRLWYMGGVHLEKIGPQFQPLGGFAGLELIDYKYKEGRYPMLTTGVTADIRLRNGNLGLKLIGGLGLVFHEYDYYRGISSGQVYYAWSIHKGDYVGLLATWEYGLPRRYKKGKKSAKKGKRKRKKR